MVFMVACFSDILRNFAYSCNGHMFTVASTFEIDHRSTDGLRPFVDFCLSPCIRHEREYKAMNPFFIEDSLEALRS